MQHQFETYMKRFAASGYIEILYLGQISDCLMQSVFWDCYILHIVAPCARWNLNRVWFFARPFRANNRDDLHVERCYVNSVLQFATGESHSLCMPSRANVFLAESILLLPIRDERRPVKTMSLRTLVAAVTRIFHRRGFMRFLRALRQRKRSHRRQSWNFASGSFRLFNRKRSAITNVISSQ